MKAKSARNKIDAKFWVWSRHYQTHSVKNWGIFCCRLPRGTVWTISADLSLWRLRALGSRLRRIGSYQQDRNYMVEGRPLEQDEPKPIQFKLQELKMAKAFIFGAFILVLMVSQTQMCQKLAIFETKKLDFTENLSGWKICEKNAISTQP